VVLKRSRNYGIVYRMALGRRLLRDQHCSRLLAGSQGLDDVTVYRIISTDRSTEVPSCITPHILQRKLLCTCKI
jgi:hypothetical protein